MTNRPIRIAIVGCGTIARDVHLPAFAAVGPDRATVVAFASRSLESARRAADQWGGGDVLADWRDVISRNDVDAVDICAPNAFHRDMAVAASEAGKHVLVEKPMAITLEEADQMVGAAAAAGRLLMPAHNVRFAPSCTAAAGALAQGRIGLLVAVRAVLGHTGPDDWAPGTDWFFDRKRSGGGALIDLGVHLFDLVRAVTGDEITVEGTAMRPRAGNPDIEDAAEVAFRLGSGAIGSLRASWDTTPPSGLQLTLVGTEGTIAAQSGKFGPPTLSSPDGSQVQLELPPPGNPCAAFIDAVAGRAPLPVDGRDGRAALAAVLSAYDLAAARP
jgi:UDP-N-acetylglucosamine 3-dehydrogenase